MIVFLKGRLEVLDYFVDCMMQLEGVESVALDVSSQSFAGDFERIEGTVNHETIVIIFNNVGLDFTYDRDGRNVWEKAGVRLYNIMVDHPCYFKGYMENPIANMNIIVVDRSHKKYIETYFKKVKAVYYLPHGGIEKEPSATYQHRKIDVLYIGSCQEKRERVAVIDCLPESGQECYSYIFKKLMENSSLDAEAALKSYLYEKAIALEVDQQSEAILFVEDAIKIVRRHYKLMTMRHLAENHIAVEIYGDHWDEVAEEYPDFIKIHQRVTSDECIDLIKQSRIVLTCMPWFKDGAHERIYNTMLNGAVCVTDRSRYLEEKFEHGKNIVFYDYHDLVGLAADIRFLLENAHVAETIAENGYLRAQTSTWMDRLNNIINENFEHFI